jgi:AraC-like DNA-binding protein
VTEALALRNDALSLSEVELIEPIGSPAASPRPSIPPLTLERLHLARARLLEAARTGERIRTYEVALDLDMSEFHFARQFRIAFDCSPHVFYDQARADRARNLLNEGLAEGAVAKRIGLRRPAELRALLAKR